MQSGGTNRSLRAAWGWLALLGFLAIGQHFLANGRPLYCRIGDTAYFPGLRLIWAAPERPYGVPALDSIARDPLQWKTFPYQSAVFAPIPFTPGEWFPRPACNLAAPGTPHPGLPPRFRHWLGTDAQGRDVAAGMIAGARIALLTGALATLAAFGLGMLLGGVAGYFGDNRLKMRRGVLAGSLLGLAIGAIWTWILPQTGWPIPYALLPALVGALAGRSVALLLARRGVGNTRIGLPADLLIMRTAEIFNAVPRLILLVALAAMSARQSTWLMIGLIGLFSWPDVAQFIRAEMLRIREMDYIAAARGMGLPELQVLWRHALPNALRPALVVCAFGVGNAILLEASLSFLGFGGQDFQGISWGSLLQNVVQHREAWWLAVPPGLAIGLTIYMLNRIGDSKSGGY